MKLFQSFINILICKLIGMFYKVKSICQKIFDAKIIKEKLIVFLNKQDMHQFFAKILWITNLCFRFL
jgi:hypothetical protein